MSDSKINGLSQPLSDEEQEQATRELLEQWSSAPLPEVERGVDDQAQIQALRGVLRGVSERRAKWRSRVPVLAATVAVAAALVAVVFGGARDWVAPTDAAAGDAPVAALPSDVAVVGEVRVASVEPGQPQAPSQGLRQGDVLRRGAALNTARGQLNLQFPSGATAALSPQSLARVSEAGEGRREALFLSMGAVDVEVPKLAQPVEFSVRTPTALVVVHGTRFRVEVAPVAGGTRTDVQVTRGVVTVHVEGKPVHRLTAGQRWPELSGSAEAVEPTAESKTTAKTPAKLRKRNRLSPRGKRSAVPRRRSATRSTASKSRSATGSATAKRPSAKLGLENEQFARAMRHKNEGNNVAALRSIEGLLRAYPQSVLVQEARVERFRLLRHMGRESRAIAAARDYLDAHPRGYARREAKDLLEGGP